MSGRLGDVNGNNLLDVSEVWIYNCKTNLRRTTTNTVRVTAFANGLEARSDATITVQVDTSNLASGPRFSNQPAPDLPETGEVSSLKTKIWGVLSGILAILIVLFAITRRRKFKNGRKEIKTL